VDLATIINLVGILYGAASLDERKKQRQQINDEVCAIYQVVYENLTYPL
jgi:ABC-type Co2+ transport system permease subunit